MVFRSHTHTSYALRGEEVSPEELQMGSWGFALHITRYCKVCGKADASDLEFLLSTRDAHYDRLHSELRRRGVSKKLPVIDNMFNAYVAGHYIGSERWNRLVRPQQQQEGVADVKSTAEKNSSEEKSIERRHVGLPGDRPPRRRLQLHINKPKGEE